MGALPTTRNSVAATKAGPSKFLGPYAFAAGNAMDDYTADDGFLSFIFVRGPLPRSHGRFAEQIRTQDGHRDNTS